MFKECMLREMQGQPLLYHGETCDLESFEEEKQKVSAELKKRKSLIPWHKCKLVNFDSPVFSLIKINLLIIVPPGCCRIYCFHSS